MLQMSSFYTSNTMRNKKNKIQKKITTESKRGSSQQTFLCKIKWKISLQLLMSSKVEAYVCIKAYDSITQGKSVRHVLRESKSQMICVSVACASTLITKYVKHSCQINTQIRITGIPDGTKIYYDITGILFYCPI